jgi:membrane protease subunit (stomatin/prohibitin family)
MGFWKHVKAQFLDVIEWMEDDRSTLVWRYPVFNQAIQDGGRLVVREGQGACFQSEGKLSDTFGPGTHEISTRTPAIWGFFQSIKYGFNYPYKGDIFFVSTRRFFDNKWGTPGPIMMEDSQLGIVEVRAFGTYSYRITDGATFIREVVGNAGLFTTDEINRQLKRTLSSAFVDTLGEAKIPVMKLASQYMDLGEAMRERMSHVFEERYGIALTEFVVERVSMPDEVTKFLRKRQGMALVGVGDYTQFQAANALEQAASNPGGGNAMMDAGMGMAMGGVMGAQMMGSMGRPGPSAPPPLAAAPPPPPPPPPQPGAQVFHYSGPSGQAQYSAEEIAALVAENRAATHHIWSPGWAGWKSWNEVPEVAGQVPPPMPPG